MNRIGSLFSGAGGLDLAVEAVFGGQVIWQSEIDTAASKVLAHRFPDAPNLGDITAVDWNQIEKPDILCGGFPCQDVSAAGKRAGIKAGTRSGLWTVFAEAIDYLRPPLVVIENVRGLLSAKAHRNMESDDPTMGKGRHEPVLRAIGAVLGDLSEVGYDARWATVSAASVGAPHRRERVFIVATSATQHLSLTGSLRAQGKADSTGEPPLPGPVSQLLPTPVTTDAAGARNSTRKAHNHNSGTTLTDAFWELAGISDRLLPTPAAADGRRGQDFARANRAGSGGDDLVTLAVKASNANQWGKYAEAIERWEQIVGPAPAPTEPNRNGNPRLNPAFSEWMMGWTNGWVTDPVLELKRTDQLRIIGNGVCSQQAEAALRFLMSINANPQ